MAVRPHALATAVLIAALCGCDYGKGLDKPGNSALDSLIVRPASVTLHAGGLRYTQDVQVIFHSSCALTRCHAGHARAAGLSLESFELLAAGGVFSGDVVRAGVPDASALIQRIESEDQGFLMPQFGPPLPVEQQLLLRHWVRDGLVRFRAVRYTDGDSAIVIPTWGAGPGGMIAPSGLFTVDTTGGTVTVTATADGLSGQASVLVEP